MVELKIFFVNSEKPSIFYRQRVGQSAPSPRAGYFFMPEILYEHGFVGTASPKGLLFQMPHYNKGVGTLPPSRGGYLSREKLFFVLLSYT